MAIKRKRTIEIYFVLYLAALVFLLPDKRDIDRYFLNSLGTPIFQPMFTLLPEKTTLTCRAIIDSTGPKILSIDSVNTIFYSGDVENVNFEFEIEDQTLRQSIKLTSDNKPSTKFFKLIQHKEQQAASFLWAPPLHEKASKTYLVRVIATAKSRGNNPIFLGQKDGSGSPQTFRVRTQFSLLLIYLNRETGLPMFPQMQQQNVPGFDSNALFVNSVNNLIPNYSDKPISVSASNSEVSAIAYQKWTNVINFSPIDVSKFEKLIKIDNYPPENGGDASISNIGEINAVLQGKTPSYGYSQVTFKLKRKTDQKEFYTVFRVRPQHVEQPEYEKFMYPDQTYLIDPKLPVMGKETKAFIKDGNSIRARSEGEKFTLIPDIADTGKIFYLERYIDNNLLGQKLPIRILNFPEPEILQLTERGNNEVDVQTRAFGYQNREKNEIVRFEVQGNARYEDKRGRMIDKDASVRIQHFIFTPVNANRPFEFKIIAIDKRGKRSFMKSYKKD